MSVGFIRIFEFPFVLIPGIFAVEEATRAGRQKIKSSRAEIIS
jgi:hypothetical protein